MVSKEKKLELIKKFGGSETNSGQTEVQVAILTEEINDLNKHFATNKKDLHSMRGFIAKIEKRKSLLKYLRTNDFDKYKSLIKSLGLRK